MPLSPPSQISIGTRSLFDPEKASAEIARIIGDDHVRGDEFSGMVTARPGSDEELSNLLRLAHKQNWAVIPAGAGTWLDVGNRLRDTGIVISVSRLYKLIEYEPADLVVTTQAGITLSKLNSMLSDQWLPLDPPDDGRATIGGVAATGLPGAQALGYGAPRHHIVGMRVALADGRVIKAGGRVVKNVAGYDLCKLFTGSYGTLGVIFEITCKLRPRPEVETTIIARSEDIRRLIEAGKHIVGSDLLPVAAEIVSAGEIDFHDGLKNALMVRFAGKSEAVHYQIERASRLVESCDLAAEVNSDDAQLWSALAAVTLKYRDRAIWRSTVPRDRIGEMIAAVEQRSTTAALWHASLDGRMRVIETDMATTHEDSLASWHELGQTAVSLGGCLVIESAPSVVKDNIDAWGEAGKSSEIMRRLKAQLDGQSQFSPGRFVSGI